MRRAIRTTITVIGFSGAEDSLRRARPSHDISLYTVRIFTATASARKARANFAVLSRGVRCDGIKRMKDISYGRYKATISRAELAALK